MPHAVCLREHPQGPLGCTTKVKTPWLAHQNRASCRQTVCADVLISGKAALLGRRCGACLRSNQMLRSGVAAGEMRLARGAGFWGQRMLPKASPQHGTAAQRSTAQGLGRYRGQGPGTEFFSHRWAAAPVLTRKRRCRSSGGFRCTSKHFSKFEQGCCAPGQTPSFLRPGRRRVWGKWMEEKDGVPPLHSISDLLEGLGGGMRQVLRPCAYRRWAWGLRCAADGGWGEPREPLRPSRGGSILAWAPAPAAGQPLTWKGTIGHRPHMMSARRGRGSHHMRRRTVAPAQSCARDQLLRFFNRLRPVSRGPPT